MQIDHAVKFLSRATRLRLQRHSLDHHGAQTRKIGRRSSRQLPGFNGAIESLFDEPHSIKVFDPSIKGATDRFAYRFVKR